MAQARHGKCASAPNPFSHWCMGDSNRVLETDKAVNPYPFSLVICPHKCIPVHSISAVPLPHLSSFPHTHTHTHKHTQSMHSHWGSGVCRPLFLPLQLRGVIQQREKLPHPPNPTCTHMDTHMHTYADRQAHAFNILPSSRGWRCGHSLYHTGDHYCSR